jgi:uncharacterized membrane protein YdjX (TVP38/TMEM64 family)
MTDPATSKARSRRLRIVAAVVAGMSLLAIVAYIAWPFLSTFSDPDKARRLIVDAGAWGPLVFTAMQVVQVLVAPIPGQVTALVGGYLFGPVLGLVYTMVGATIGFTLIFVLARKLGRPFVERFISPKLLERFDYLADTRGVLVLFLIFVLPAFPDDVISFIAGLTHIRIRTLVFVSLAGRLPGYVVLSATGNGLADENMNPIVVAAVVMVVILGVAYWQRAWLRDLVDKRGRGVVHQRAMEPVPDSHDHAVGRDTDCQCGPVYARDGDADPAVKQSAPARRQSPPSEPCGQRTFG